MGKTPCFNSSSFKRTTTSATWIYQVHYKNLFQKDTKPHVFLSYSSKRLAQLWASRTITF